MTTLTGRCLCGAVTWSTDARILWSGHCHCDSCRRATASPFTSFMGVARGSVMWTGALGCHRSTNQAVERQFCANCGTQMTYQSTRWPSETHLYAGTMDDPTKFQPRAHFHFDERLPWIAITDDLPKYAATADDAKPIA